MQLSPSTGPDGEPSPAHFPDILPLFPLPNVVFFPRTYLPLHIFEPRYREMVRVAASSHRMIGMVVLKEGWEANYEGTPEIFPLGCMGRIAAMHSLPDGRSNILLQGLRRFEIVEEVGAEAYRQGHMVYKNLHPDPELPADLRTELVRLVTEELASKGEVFQISAFLKKPLLDDALIQSLSFALEFTILEKQFLLESESLLQQARRLLDLLQFKLHERPKHRTDSGQIEWI
jgi:Lon protease-like protein